jgi:hypothetical protein
MANVDYVLVAGQPSPPSPDDVMQAVKVAIDATEVIDGNRLHTADERAEVTVWSRSWQPSTTVVEVYHAADEDQRELSRRIYNYLVEHTAWNLTFDSDNAADVIASRVKTPT